VVGHGLEVAACVTKPIRQSDLLDAITASIRPKTKARSRTAQPSIQKTTRPLSILLAEDNELNQKLVVRILEKRGHRVTVAGNGREAIALLGKADHPIDILLIDIQMPEMSGFETTAVIREGEKQTTKHLTIVALTAHVRKEDRERCLAAGMDSYIAKPVRTKELIKTVEELARPETTEEPLARKASADQVVDEAALLERVDNDTRLLKKMVGFFLADYPKSLAEIRGAIDGQDAEKLASAAHTLAGSVANFEAQYAVGAVRKLETMARKGDLVDAEKTFARLNKEMGRLEKALGSMVNPKRGKKT
jgi:CheY-like chemotaxis protein